MVRRRRDAALPITPYPFPSPLVFIRPTIPCRYGAVGLLWLLLFAGSPLLSRSKYFSTRHFYKGHAKALQRDQTRKDAVPFDKVRVSFGIIMERYECPAASRMKSARHLEETAFRQGFGNYFPEGGDVASTEDTVDMALERRESIDLAELDLDYYREIDAGFVVPQEPLSAKPPQPAVAESNDPVIRHLDGALSALNEVLVDLGGPSEFSHHVDKALLEQEARQERKAQRRSARRVLVQPQRHGGAARQQPRQETPATPTPTGGAAGGTEAAAAVAVQKADLEADPPGWPNLKV